MVLEIILQNLQTVPGIVISAIWVLGIILFIKNIVKYRNWFGFTYLMLWLVMGVLFLICAEVVGDFVMKVYYLVKDKIVRE